MKQNNINTIILKDNHNNIEELCPFISEFKQPIDNFRCSSYYDKCIVYQRFKVLDIHRTKTGLERFRERYKDFDYGRQLGI